MSTNRSFSTMLNDYLVNDLLKEEMVKRDYLLNKVEKDDGWVGGPLIVPFKGAGGSSVSFGSLSASNDIAEDVYVRGSVATQPEVWGSMIFNHRDLMEHDKISEKNFLKLLPDAVEDFMDLMKFTVSTNLLGSANFATLTADGTNLGVLVVDRPERFVIGQKVIVQGTAQGPTTGYVRTIVMDTGTITCYSARSGGAVVDFSLNTVADASKVYNDGQLANGFSSLRGALLSNANGGTASLYGQTKTAYPYLQAINVSGADITAANIMSKIFDALTTIRNRGKGNPTDVVMSYKNFGSCIKVIEGSKGAFNVTPNSKSASQYGWTEIEVGSVAKGGLKLVGVQEADDDVIYFIDWRALTFHSNGFFRKRISPDGLEYFELRNTTGYQYIVDICLFGDLVVKRPSYCGILYSISY